MAKGKQITKSSTNCDIKEVLINAAITVLIIILKEEVEKK